MTIPADSSAVPSPIPKPIQHANTSTSVSSMPITNKIIAASEKILPTSAPPPLQESSAKGRLAQAKIPTQAAIAQELENIKKTQGDEQAGSVEAIIKGTKTSRLPSPTLVKLSQLNALFAHQGRPLPSAFSQLGPDDEMAIMWRGCRGDQLVNMVNHQSAGGIPFNLEALPPTEEEAKRQVGETLSLPEFTTKPAIAEHFGKGIVVAVFAIPKRYLTEGSGSEKGWVASKETPVALLAWKEGAPLAPILSSHSATQINQGLSAPRIHRPPP